MTSNHSVIGGVHTVVMAQPDGPVLGSWRNPRRAEIDGQACFVGAVGSNGVQASVGFIYPDLSSDFLRAPLADIGQAHEPFGRLFNESEQLSTGAQRLAVSDSHLVAHMGALIWVFGPNAERTRRGGPNDMAGAPWLFSSTVALVGDRIIGTLGSWQIGTFEHPAAEPTILYDRPNENTRLLYFTDDGIDMVWVEHDFVTDRYELWSSPHALTPEGMQPRLVYEMEEAGWPILGDGLAAMQQGRSLLIVDLADGRTRRCVPPFNQGFHHRLQALTPDELIGYAIVRPDTRQRYVRIDLSALPYETNPNGR